MSLTDPTTLSPVVYGRSESIWVPVWKDKDDAVIQNSAKDIPYYVQYDLVPVQAIHGIQYLATLSDSTIRDQVGATNNSTWRSAWLAGEALITDVNFDSVTVDNVSCVRVHHVVLCRRGGWVNEFPDVGYVYTSGTDWKQTVDADGNQILGKLDTDGSQLAAGTDLKTIQIEPKRQISFAGLNF